MISLRHILRLFVAILFVVNGAGTAFSMPMAASEITFYQTENTLLSQASYIGNAARAPPLAVADVATTGGVTVMYGNAFALHGQETVAALFGFGGYLNVPNSGRFSGITARNTDETQFLRNAEATFGNSTTWTGITRHRGELVVQRSNIELSPQNITRLRNGNAPFVRNSSGEWEPLQLHHVGRETGQLIEVTRSQNRYNSTTGGPLHIPGPGGPIRQPNYSQTYWQERYQSFVNSGQIVE